MLSPEPAFYFEENGVPVFTPTMEEFADFYAYVSSIDPVAKSAGLAKIIPPKEWTDRLSDVTPLLEKIQIKKAITQDITGGNLPAGTYRQLNVETRRVFSVQAWHDFAESSQHRPPTFDNEGRVTQSHSPAAPKKKVKRKDDVDREGSIENKPPDTHAAVVNDHVAYVDADGNVGETTNGVPVADGKVVENMATDGAHVNGNGDVNGAKPPPRKRKRTAWEGEPITFDVTKLSSGYSLEYCRELERFYWRNVTYAAPLYGADLLGSLFDKSKPNAWNVAKLDNVLTRINMNLPGVNLPYLYFGMWKATFAWHVEDMDLYSINYIHFGAPKQWYVIPTAHRTRFERLARSIFSEEKCPEFLRHKSYLISPMYLQKQSIPVQRLIQYAGEFVITFPSGYHAGFNLGFNCAESVNFALERWIEIGRQARFCECEPDSVRLDVSALFGLNGEILPQPPSDPTVPKPMGPGRSMKSMMPTAPKPKAPPKPAPPKPAPVKVAPIIIKCVLCPGQDESDLLPTTIPGQRVHRLCALYVPETFIVPDAEGHDVVHGVDGIPKDRWTLKCLFCRPSERRGKKQNALKPVPGACIQCQKGKCVRAYHASCASANGVLLTEDFQSFCNQHDGRPKPPKKRRDYYEIVEEEGDDVEEEV
ncbi:Lysine-specific demethylase 4B [Irineochytrium annulatum]|nr:Lysine-specific demethylase 4B [Irineochytrium annulatum]